MENTRIKLSETVMVIDAAYLNFVINDLKKYFEPLLGRSLQTVIWHFLPCIWLWMPG